MGREGEWPVGLVGQAGPVFSLTNQKRFARVLGIFQLKPINPQSPDKSQLSTGLLSESTSWWRVSPSRQELATSCGVWCKHHPPAVLRGVVGSVTPSVR